LENLDISDAEVVSGAFSASPINEAVSIFVIHFAVYYHYGRGWRREYDIHNIRAPAM